MLTVWSACFRLERQILQLSWQRGALRSGSDDALRQAGNQVLAKWTMGIAASGDCHTNRFYCSLLG
jgi:hypothetical protein